VIFQQLWFSLALIDMLLSWFLFTQGTLMSFLLS
jgi:predicted acyltransferase